MKSQLGNYLILFRWVSPQLDPFDAGGPQFRGLNVDRPNAKNGTLRTRNS
jgi:hypothetical protein